MSDVSLTSFTNTTSDPYNFDSDRGDADLDRRHSFVSNVVYVLPSFRSWGKVAEFTLGDWQLNGIASYFGATPIELITGVDRKSTRLNSSHLVISYAVFCLKKKTYCTSETSARCESCAITVEQ